MFDKIILIDHRFPYEYGEDFILNEIPFLLEKCNKLIIVPTEAADFERKRISSDNKIILWNHNKKVGKFSKIIRSVPAILKKAIRQELKGLFADHNLNIHTFLGLLYFQIECERKKKEIVSWIRQYVGGGDHILIYSYWLYTTAYIAGLLKEEFPRARIVSRAHRFDIYLERNTCNYLPLRQAVFGKLDLICPISDDGTKYLSQTYPDIIDKIKTYRLGTMDYGINPEKTEKIFKLVSCSNLIPVKRVHLIIDILKKVRDLEIEWTHYGDGIQKKTLEEYAGEALGPNISYNFAGSVSNLELMKIYAEKHFDLFINVSESEGIPVSIMEAMSFGIPVIATDVGGTSEIVENCYNGVLIEPEFIPGEVAGIIINLSNSDNSDMRSAARKSWEKKYNAVNNYRKFYEDLEKQRDGL